jgi:RNA polymerase sigma-70 factor (ECF subfamily)
MAWMTVNPHEVLIEFTPALARLVASYERDPALREELLQEVLLAIVVSLPRLTRPDRLKPYIFRIAHNRSVSHIARRMRERELRESSEPEDVPAPSQEQALIESEHGDRLLRAIRQLTLPLRQVMTLLLEDMSYEDIAETLGISVSNVGVRVSRAKTQLKEILRHD